MQLARDRKALPSGSLGFIHRFVGALRQRLARRSRLRIDGDADLAIAYFESALEDDPDDRAWNRVYLINALLAERALGEARDVLADYREPHAAYWTWSNALRLYLDRGDRSVSRSMLRVAIGRNALVPAVLLGRIGVPDELPAEFEFGTVEEAVLYAAHALEVWDEVPGALEWLRTVERDVRRIGPDDVLLVRVRLLLSRPRIWRRCRLNAPTAMARPTCTRGNSRWVTWTSLTWHPPTVRPAALPASNCRLLPRDLRLMFGTDSCSRRVAIPMKT